jgi:hypothetical protein
VKDDEMVRACSTHGKKKKKKKYKKNAYRILEGNSEGKKPLERP